MAISSNGRPEPGKDYEVPRRQGRAVRLGTGDRLTIVNPSGHQVCDFFAVVEGAPVEMLSMEHCRTSLGRVFVRVGDRLVSNRRRPLIEIAADTSDGVHDILVACCDGPRYAELGHHGPHASCADNLRASLAALGIPVAHIPSPFNIWMNVPLGPDGSLSFAAPTARPGDRIELIAIAPIVAVMSACPQDLTPVNGPDGQPGPLTFRVDR